jgi:hypothetical protein
VGGTRWLPSNNHEWGGVRAAQARRGQLLNHTMVNLNCNMKSYIFYESQTVPYSSLSQFFRYDTKAWITKFKKQVNWNSSKLKTFVYQRTLLRKWKKAICRMGKMFANHIHDKNFISNRIFLKKIYKWLTCSSMF